MSANEVPVKLSPPRPRMRVLDETALCLSAPAKINLNLLVGPRRDDGYHPVDSYVARVSLYDILLIRARHDGRILFSCRGMDCGDVEKNLALQAARRLADTTGAAGADIELLKHIPPAKGLGGGSSDAATVLWGLTKLWNVRLPEDRMAKLCLSLGSDVPLFLGPPAARVTARGESIEPIDIAPFWAVLYMPDCSCSTAEVYRAFDRQALCMEEQIDGSVFNGPPSTWRSRLHNQLTAAAEAVCPQVRAARESLCRAAPVPLCMSGSGSAMFILCDCLAEAQGICTGLPHDIRRRCVVVQNNHW